MARLVLLLVLAFGCAPLQRVGAPETSSLGSSAAVERAPRQVSRLGPFTGVGAGVRRIDALTE